MDFELKNMFSMTNLQLQKSRSNAQSDSDSPAVSLLSRDILESFAVSNVPRTVRARDYSEFTTYSGKYTRLTICVNHHALIYSPAS